MSGAAEDALEFVVREAMDTWRIGYDPADTGPTMAEAVAQAVRSMATGMTTYKRADGELMFGEWRFAGDMESCEDEARDSLDPIEYVEEQWVRVGERRFTLPLCHDCDSPATHWGLCEAHAREDDPEHFAELASRGVGATTDRPGPTSQPPTSVSGHDLSRSTGADPSPGVGPVRGAP